MHENMTEKEAWTYTLITVKLKILPDEPLGFLLLFDVLPVPETGSKFTKPTTKFDSFHLTPTIFRFPSTTGVTVSCT